MGRCLFKLGLVILVGMAANLQAHDSLYHYLEVSFPREGGPPQIAFSLHAADLESARTLGADPTSTDLSWLRNRASTEVAPLLEEGRMYLSKAFSLVMGGRELALGESLKFPENGILATEGEAARPGFLIATLSLPESTGSLELHYAPTAGKRLMVVVNRPGRFPEVRDLAPGETTDIDLSKP